MRKISEIIQEVVLKQPFLEEALHHGYLNLTGFAEYIRPYIEKEIQKEASTHAIKMALSRLERPDTISQYSKSFHASRISTISNLSIRSIIRSPRTMEMVHSIFSHKIDQKGYCAIIEGSSEIDIIYDESFGSTISDLILPELSILSLEGLSLCSLRLRDEEIYQEGLFYSITKQLAFHNINIVQVISTYHEFGIIIKNEDLKKTVTVLLG